MNQSTDSLVSDAATPAHFSHMKAAYLFRVVAGMPVKQAYNGVSYVPTPMAEANIREEYNEFMAELAGLAALHPTERYTRRPQLLKELSDLVYTCYQLAAEAGWDLDEALKRVHVSNMSKLTGPEGPVVSPGGKVQKGSAYQPPVLNDLVA